MREDDEIQFFFLSFSLPFSAMGRTMATSTVARTSTMAPLLFIAMFITALASAQSVSPSNTTFTDTELSRQTKLTLNGDDGQASFSLAPLTPQTGKNGLSPTEINVRCNITTAPRP